jgi:hypothetical protein
LQIRPLGTLGAERGQRALVDRRRLEDVELEGAVPREDEVARRRFLQALRLFGRARRSRELERLAVVMCQQLGAILRAVVRERFQPLGGQPVLLGPARSWNRAVGDVADEHVQERVLALALDRRPPFPAQEVSAREPLQPLLESPAVGVRDRRHGAGPKHLSDDCGVLDQLLVFRRKAVDPRGDHALHGLGQRELAVEAALVDHAGELLRVQRIAAGAVEQSRLHIRR